MIKLEHVVLASPEQMEFIIEGMRNPMNSWNKSDSFFVEDGEYHDIFGNSGPYNGTVTDSETFFEMGDNDYDLMRQLSKAGTDHRKFMRQMPVYVRVTAPLYWWKEFETYRVGVAPNPADIESNSCSTMHKIQEKEFTLDDFSCEHLDGETIPLFTDGNLIKDDGSYGTYNCSAYDFMSIACDVLNVYRNRYLETKKKPMKDESARAELLKKYWWQMIQLLPSSYNQTRNVMMNYEVLANIYKSRKNHKLDEWVEFCKWIETLPYSELITGKEEEPKFTNYVELEEYSSSPVSKAYSILVDARNNNDMENLDINEVIGYLGEALE